MKKYISMLQAALPRNDAEADIEEVLARAQAIASVGTATMQMLETLLPAAAQEVARESEALSAHFMVVAGYVQDSSMPPAVKHAIESMIVGIQFQDRHTQVMDNAAAMLERYRLLLEDLVAMIAMLPMELPVEPQIAEALGAILPVIRLSDLRRRYADALRAAHLPAMPMDMTLAETTSSIDMF